jgi:hypothetical protein
MEDDGDDDGHVGSEHTSDASSDSEDMDDEDEDDVEDDDGESDGNSIIDMLEEQQMEADQADGADGWTTDTDSAEEGEEMDEDESNEDEFGGFPPPPIPVLDEDELDYSEDDLDDGADVDEVRQMMGNLEGEIFDPMPDEDDDEDQMLRQQGWIMPPRGNVIRPGGSILVNQQLMQGGLQIRGGLFTDQRPRTTVRRSGTTTAIFRWLISFSFPSRAKCHGEPSPNVGQLTGPTANAPRTRHWYGPTYTATCGRTTGSPS